MRQTFVFVLAVVVGAIALAFGLTRAPDRSQAVVAGLLVREGGPPTAPAVLLDGTVVATSPDGAQRSAPARHGRFEIHLADGTYRITGSSPDVMSDNAPMTCVAQEGPGGVVQVSHTRAVTVHVVCNIR